MERGKLEGTDRMKGREERKEGGWTKKREKKEQSVRLNVSDRTVNTVCFQGSTAGCCRDPLSFRIECGVQITAAPSRDAASLFFC